jgi:BlaI family transcriptional regulator, penicillinase repressor
MSTPESLSRRERQIVDMLYALGEGGAREIADAMREPDAYDSIRVTLGVLERKGLVKFRVDGRRHIYAPSQPRSDASRSAWRRLLRTFFGGSPGRALISLLDMSGDKLADDEFEKLSRWVAEQSRRRQERAR